MASHVGAGREPLALPLPLHLFYLFKGFYFYFLKQESHTIALADLEQIIKITVGYKFIPVKQEILSSSITLACQFCLFHINL